MSWEREESESDYVVEPFQYRRDTLRALRQPLLALDIGHIVSMLHRYEPCLMSKQKGRKGGRKEQLPRLVLHLSLPSNHLPFLLFAFE